MEACDSIAFEGEKYRIVSSLVSVVFFFRVEDGIRRQVRSRGLADVYRSQEEC